MTCIIVKRQLSERWSSTVKNLPEELIIEVINELHTFIYNTTNFTLLLFVLKFLRTQIQTFVL